MAFATLDFVIADGIGVLTLKRPDVLNALDIAMAREIRQLTDELRNARPARALIVTGAGRAFCAGGDLASVKLGQDGMQARSLEITGELHHAVINLMRMDAPVIAAVNGVAAGAGFALACACDLILAAPGAKFMAAYTLAGLSPDLGLTYTLPRIIGLGAAKSLILTNRSLGAQDARALGLVAEVVEEPDLITRAREVCAEILRGGAEAIGATKRLLQDAWDTPLETQLAHESKRLAALSATDDSFARCQKFVK